MRAPTPEEPQPKHGFGPGGESRPKNESVGNNNFDLLRFVFASTVFYVHMHVLSDNQSLAFLSRYLSSEVAVQSFFVISGFLVFMSFEKSATIGSYFEKRARRIYPAYLAVVVLSSFVLFAFSSAPFREYLSLDLVKYLAANLVFLNFAHPTLPGVFDLNKLNEVNGALWTLKIEVMFYFSVPAFVLLFRRVGHLQAMVGVYLVSAFYSFLMGQLSRESGSLLYSVLQRQLPGQLTYFMVGACVFYFLTTFKDRLHLFGFAGALILLLNHALPLSALQPLALGLVVCYLAFFKFLGNFGRYGDFSYGVYIVHFPILQCLVSSGVFGQNPELAALLSTVFVLFSAILLWHTLEKRFLKRSSHYVAAAGPVTGK